ncbi:MAG: hypothetical protein J7513_18315 [Solirubrobacteraceae bacterium]|nr:hypothetical protein [Solirubrobacteraceae bacterium]
MSAEAAATVALEGDEFRWELELLWAKYRGDSELDGEIIDAKVSMQLTGVGRFTAERPVNVFTADLAAFRESLEELLGGRPQESTFLTLEQDAGLVITRGTDDDVYDVEAFVLWRPSPELRASQLRVAKRELQVLLFGVQEASEAFPVGTRWAEDA